MTYEPVWGSIIAWYLFLAGLGGGAFIAAGIASWLYPQAARVRKIGRIIGIVTVCIGLALLMLDARAGFHNPWRFALLLDHLNTSVMSWGVVFLAVFMIIGFIALIVEIVDSCMRGAKAGGAFATKHPERVQKGVKLPEWLNIAGMFFALCVGGYTGALLGAVKTFPLWNHPLLPVLFLVSALSTGFASVVLFGMIFARKETEGIVKIKYMHFGMAVTEIILLGMMFFILNFHSVDAHATVVSILAGQWAPLFWVCMGGGGLVLPTLVEAWELFIHKGGETPVVFGAGLVSEALVLMGGFFLRYLVIVAALPAGFSAGFVF
ncbi:MAG: polysulfide reductase NrfD [Coriobacteriia bacterium]|nr:polysulfide reductase NrfD [Coriobacteriia bacterium]